MYNYFYLLKAAETALNTCPRQKIYHEEFKDSYEVAAAIGKYMREVNIDFPKMFHLLDSVVVSDMEDKKEIMNMILHHYEEKLGINNEEPKE